MSDKRLRTLYVLDILKELTNGDNGITMPRILAELENRGIGAERKAVYEDIRALCDYYGADIVMDRSGGNSDYRLLSRDFETAELRLLVDAVQIHVLYIYMEKQRCHAGENPNMLRRHGKGFRHHFSRYDVETAAEIFHSIFI